MSSEATKGADAVEAFRRLQRYKSASLIHGNLVMPTKSALASLQHHRDPLPHLKRDEEDFTG